MKKLPKFKEKVVQKDPKQTKCYPRCCKGTWLAQKSSISDIFWKKFANVSKVLSKSHKKRRIWTFLRFSKIYSRMTLKLLKIQKFGIIINRRLYRKKCVRLLKNRPKIVDFSLMTKFAKRKPITLYIFEKGQSVLERILWLFAVSVAQ